MPSRAPATGVEISSVFTTCPNEPAGVICETVA